MAKKIGYAGKLYGGTAGTTASTEITHAKNVKVSVSMDTVDATDRSNNGWKDNLTALKDASLSFTLVYDSTDTNYAAIRAAAIAGTPYAFKPDNGNGSGLDADWVITKFDENQDIGEAISADVEAVPYCGNRNPTWTSDTTSNSNSTPA
ncbi:MAG: hypothetical protein IJJ33_15810 [Victivallales bacterium]|nr:hypothetical protein [Victivallales bacterium]